MKINATPKNVLLLLTGMVFTFATCRKDPSVSDDKNAYYDFEKIGDLPVTFTGMDKASIIFPNSLNGILYNHESVIVTQDCGKSWIIPTLDTRASLGRSISLIGNSLYLFSGDGIPYGWGLLFKSTNYGMTWQTIYNVPYLYQATMVSDRIGYNHLVYYSNPDEIKKTTNGGQSWNSTNVPIDNIDKIHFYDSLNGFITSEQFLSQYYTTSDGGATWTQRTKANIRYSMLEQSGNRTLLIPFLSGQFSKLSYSDDNGLSWTEARFSTKSQKTPDRIIAVSISPDKSYGCALATNGIFYTNDQGANWEYLHYKNDEANPYNFKNIKVVEGNRVLAFTSNAVYALGLYK